MTFYAFIGVAVTNASIAIFGRAIRVPVELRQRFTVRCWLCLRSCLS